MSRWKSGNGVLLCLCASRLETDALWLGTIPEHVVRAASVMLPAGMDVSD